MHLALHPTPNRIDPTRPSIALLHGVTASARTWWRVAPALARAGWQVLALDLPCHGASGCDEPIGRWDAADDVVATLEAELGEARVDVLWGHSLGARTALQVLVRHPATAERVVLEDPPGIRDERTEQIARWRHEAALARTDRDGYAAEVRAMDPGLDDRDVEIMVADVAACRIEPIIRAVGAGLAMTDPADELVAAIRQPALLMLADEARSALTGAARRRTEARLPAGSRTVVFASGHTVHRDLPDACVATALEWLG
ncbi:MAG: alpha/beta hydrolase [Chloroflexota bacterium]